MYAPDICTRTASSQIALSLPETIKEGEGVFCGPPIHLVFPDIAALAEFSDCLRNWLDKKQAQTVLAATPGEIVRQGMLDAIKTQIEAAGLECPEDFPIDVRVGGSWLLTPKEQESLKLAVSISAESLVVKLAPIIEAGIAAGLSKTRPA